jgi:hypothetical protein
MNINEIAKALLDLREKRMSSYIMSGELREALGFEGYGEAIRRRWIMADESGSGMVTVTNHLTTVNEIRTLAQECTCKGCGDSDCTCKCKDGKCTCKKAKMESVVEDAHHIATSHAFRKQTIREYATMGLGRTGDAPETPVVGLGNEHSAPPPTTSVNPPVAAAGATAAPAATPYNPQAGMHPGTVTTSVMQAEAAAQKKFGRPFAELSPDQQAQVENDLRTATPPAR